MAADSLFALRPGELIFSGETRPAASRRRSQPARVATDPSGYRTRGSQLSCDGQEIMVAGQLDLPHGMPRLAGTQAGGEEVLGRALIPLWDI